MSGRLIEEDLFTKYSIIDSRTPEGQKINSFLSARAKALAGKYIDFDKTPVTFVLSDSDQPNAFYAPAPDPDPDKKPRRDDYKTIRFITNPLDTPVICVSRGLIEMADNLDQLDFVLGHELTHMIMRGHGIERNSKGEEEIADIHAVDLMYDAGGDPKQALVMSEKISAYAKEERKREERKRYRSDEKEEGINWAEIFDVHMTDGNRKAGIEASLTRLSHLIDDRQPSAIDKSAFESRYDDPIDAFLKANHYEGKKPLGKLKILIDCIDHLSAPLPAKEFLQTIQAELDALPKDDGDRFDWRSSSRKRELQERIETASTRYFGGGVIDKKYQQKIANLAEDVIHKTQEDREQNKSGGINCADLNIYLQNKAYQHITANGYPKAGDLNYLSASGILYSYFYHLLQGHSYNRNSGEETEEKKQTQLEIDIDAAKKQILSADTAESFTKAADNLDGLTGILREVRSIKYGYESRGEKLDNLSSLSDHGRYSSRDEHRVYGELGGGQDIPWNNLVKIAKTDEKAKERVVQFLAQNGITDYRITHDLPYIRTGYSTCYGATESGQTSAKQVPEYEVDFEVHRGTVLQAHDYVRGYFDNEAALVEEKCTQALSIKDSDFIESDGSKDADRRKSIAHRKIYDFVSMFNALPEKEDDRRSYDRPKATALIPETHQIEHPIPGSRRVNSGWREHTRLDFTDELLAFDNPIFQKHFGENYKQELNAKKEAQQQRMFDTAFALLGSAVDMWLDAAPKKKALEEKSHGLYREIWDSADEAQKKAKTAENKAVQRDLALHKEKEDQTSSVVHNFLYSIFAGEKYWYQLQRLKPEQKKTLAEFAVKDEKGAIMQLLHADGYEQFCDYLGILQEQTERVIAGNHQLTEQMQLVADKYGYQHATTKEALKSFVDQHQEHKYDDNQKYAWYLHVFDAMQYLEKTPDIDVRSLAVAVNRIQPSSSSNRGSDQHEIVEARYLNYRNFVRQSNLLTLATRAIDHQSNYEKLPFDELLQTADALITLRSEMGRMFEGRSQNSYSSEKPKSEATPEQSRCLATIDKNIRGILRKAEYQALQQEDALGKITSLYRLYNHRGRYLGKIEEKEGRLKKLSALAEDKAFWPEDVLDHTKAFVFARHTFLDDKEFEDRLLNDILGKLEALPAGKKKNECLFILLDKNLRAAYPETRDRLFSIYTDDVASKLGKDDGSEQYQKRLAVYLKALESEKSKDWDIGKQHGKRDGLLSNTMSAADKYLLMRRLSDAVVSQEQTSQIIKKSCQIKLNSIDMVRSYLYGIGVDYLTTEMDRDAVMANRFIEFFNSKGEQKDCADISSYIEDTMKQKYSGRDKERLDAVLKNTQPAQCKILYENFWSAPLEARAVIIARMLKSAANGKDEQEDQATHSWEKVFDIVMDKMIRPDDTSVEAKYARDIMHSYIKSRSGYERELIMSAMMVANRNIGGDKGNIGKALKLFLENMGPAEIKLGQAIASHPDTPESIKTELQNLKSAANMPARWDLYEWIRTENIPDELWKKEHLGEVLGSASYYTTVALGEDKVLRILRPEAREKATKGFKVIYATVDDLKGKEATSDLSYKELTSSVSEMVMQAARMSAVETDHEFGQQQYEYAKGIYDNVTIASGGKAFPLKVMDWRAKGQNWIIMDRAKGQTFNAMPEETAEQRDYKRQFAKAYVVFELRNIVSGKKFDHDKHGAQLSVDPETNAVGIYDTGAMALHDPSPEEQKLLGNVIYDVLKTALKGDDAFASFSRIIGEKIDELHKNGKNTQYLVEVKKGLLALGDFFNVLTPEDIKDILPSVDLMGSVSEQVRKGITENMSLAEKVQYKAFSAMQSGAKKGAVDITRTNPTTKPDIKVGKFTVAPTKRDKSGWVQDTFSKPTDGDDDMPGGKASFVASLQGNSNLSGISAA